MFHLRPLGHLELVSKIEAKKNYQQIKVAQYREADYEFYIIIDLRLQGQWGFTEFFKTELSDSQKILTSEIYSVPIMVISSSLTS